MKNLRSIRGWSVLALAGRLLTQLVSAAPLPNAWRITHHTTADYSAPYHAHEITTHRL